METKIFEVRDRATYIPVAAICLTPKSDRERTLLARCGYGLLPEEQSKYIFLMDLNTGRFGRYPHSWGGPGRTLFEAHRFIYNNFQNLSDGQVVDVEYLLGEADRPKEPEGWL